MTLRLDLLRHGETELGGGLRGSLDDALTDAGWQQMRAAVAGQGPWDRLVSSPLQRCARFAEELGVRLALPVSLDPDLQELHFGAWEGQSAAALMATDAEALGRFWADPYAFTRRRASRCWRFPSECWGRSSVCTSVMPASGCCWSAMAG